MLDFRKWFRKHQQSNGNDKQLPKNPGTIGGYQPHARRPIGPPPGPKMVKALSEKGLREKHAPLMDAWEQYQILLKIYDADNLKPFEKAKTNGMTMNGTVTRRNGMKAPTQGVVVKKPKRPRRGGTHETI